MTGTDTTIIRSTPGAPDRRLLVLDDDPTVAQLLCTAAGNLGFETRASAAVGEFAGLLATFAPSHVVLDLTLPDTTGEQVLRLLADRGSRARVLVCSGVGAADLTQAVELARGLGLDVAGALPKPFRLAALRTLLAPLPLC